MVKEMFSSMAVGVGFSLVVHNFSFHSFRMTQECIIRQIPSRPHIYRLPRPDPLPSISSLNITSFTKHMTQVVDHCFS